jgi:hypothetical protein
MFVIGMNECVDHAVREAVHIDAEFPSLVKFTKASHGIRTRIVSLSTGGAQGPFGELNIARQAHSVGSGRGGSFGWRLASLCTYTGCGHDVGARVLDLQGGCPVHSYKANRHHFCNL